MKRRELVRLLGGIGLTIVVPRFGSFAPAGGTRVIVNPWLPNKYAHITIHKTMAWIEVSDSVMAQAVAVQGVYNQAVRRALADLGGGMYRLDLPTELVV